MAKRMTLGQFTARHCAKGMRMTTYARCRAGPEAQAEWTGRKAGGSCRAPANSYMTGSGANPRMPLRPT